MNNPAIPILKDKRAEVAAHVADLQKQIERYRTDIAHVDATLALFKPGKAAGHSPAKPVDLGKLAHLSRTVLDTMREARGKPLAASEIAAAVMASHKLPEASRATVAMRVRASLTYMAGRKSIVKVGTVHDRKWALAG